VISRGETGPDSPTGRKNGIVHSIEEKCTMRKRTSDLPGFGIAAVAALILSGANAAGPVIAADQAAVAETRTYLKRLEKLGFAGAVLVARGDEPLLAEGFGLADREHGLPWTPGTVSDIGSITKQFTGAAILKFEEDGRLSVNDPIGKYFDGVPADKAGITLHHLLTHSSGLSDPDIGDFEAVPLLEFVKQVFARPLLFAAGKGYSYANANFSLLGAILEKLSGQSYETVLRQRLFLPLGMYETGYTQPDWGLSRFAQGYEADGARWGTFLERPAAADGPHWALRANGGIHTTVYDMLRWARALLAGRVLSPASMTKLWAPHVSEGGGTFYGYGWSIAKAPDGTKIVTHNGGNGIYFADLAIVPDKGLVVFLMTNVIAQNRAANSLLEQIGMRFLGGRPYPAIPEVVDRDAAVLASFAGAYSLPAGAGAYRLATDDRGALLNSVSEAEPGRLDRLSKRMEAIIAANMKGDFAPLSKAYGGEVAPERLKARWADLIAENEKVRGRVRRFEVLGTARTGERDESVIRFYCEKGNVDLTYVWDAQKADRLLGRSARGLTVRMRLYPAGERDFFTWDGGIRPAKMVHIEPGADGKLRLTLAGAKDAAIR
jgi:CubicO group peptidase (beta-lactamase class C family)